jgi:hypothetical protein
MHQEIFTALIGVIGVLIGGLITGGINIWAEKRRHKTERLRLMSSITSTSELEKVRIQAYTDLWSRLGRVSTYRLDEIVENLPIIQEQLQDWYYHKGGGLVIAGSFEQKESTKAAFFQARDLKSSNASEIWDTIHKLRHCLRRDLKIFEDEEEEKKMIAEGKKKIGEMEH